MIPPSPINKKKTESVGTNSKNGFLFEIKNYNDHLKLFSMLNTARPSIHVVYQYVFELAFLAGKSTILLAC